MRNHTTLTVPTPRGDARLHYDRPPRPTNGTALLFHGAGGGVDAPVLIAVRDALLTLGWTVARLEQPYRVAGRRAPAPAAHLDEVATQVAATLAKPLLLAGKSSGARVACRIADAVGAVGVVCLGFPLHPPGRPDKSRKAELDGTRTPVLVLQGANDAFGRPEEFERPVHTIEGADHALTKKAHVEVVAAAARDWVQART
jgi:predicted alpha/beta-hydrolase family hydrolase